MCLRLKRGIKRYAEGGFVPPDGYIWEMIGRIEFKFGGEIHTVSEANLLFAYDVDLTLDNFRPPSIYVIALSENYGAIVFDLPEEVIEAVRKRVTPDVSFKKYICDLIEEQSAVRNLAVAAYGFGIGCEAAAEALIRLSTAIHIATENQTKSNNWLKMHGRPMRRKGKGRKTK